MLEAEKFLLRDNKQRIRAEMAMDYSATSEGNPGINLFDEQGTKRLIIGAGVLDVRDEKGNEAVLLSNVLQFTTNKNPHAAGADLRAGFTWSRLKFWRTTVLLFLIFEFGATFYFGLLNRPLSGFPNF
jgi:hypothetical protein